MNLEEKINGALRVIDTALREFTKPAIMCSFGKDSMVVLDLVRQVNPSLPVIFHREPFQPHKYKFANDVILKLGLTVYDYPPIKTEVQESDSEIEILGYYQIGQKTCMLPTGIRAPESGESFVCGLQDIYNKPIGSFNYPWDLVFHGHKSTDVDPVYGEIPLTADVARNVGTASACFPIRHFTDHDIWEYHEAHGIPIHHDRYEKTESGWAEKSDKTFNPDYITACTACMSPKNGRAVSCPRLNGLMVSNVSAQLRWATKPQLTYMESKPNAL